MNMGCFFFHLRNSFFLVIFRVQVSLFCYLSFFEASLVMPMYSQTCILISIANIPSVLLFQAEFHRSGKQSRARIEAQMCLTPELGSFIHLLLRKLGLQLTCKQSKALREFTKRFQAAKPWSCLEKDTQALLLLSRAPEWVSPIFPSRWTYTSCINSINIYGFIVGLSGVWEARGLQLESEVRGVCETGPLTCGVCTNLGYSASDCIELLIPSWCMESWRIDG